MTKAAVIETITSHGLNLRGVLRRAQDSMVNSGKVVVRVTKRSVKDAWAGQVTQEMRDSFKESADLVSKLIGKLNPVTPRVLTSFDKEMFMSELLAISSVKSPLEGREAAIKQHIKDAFIEMHRDNEVPISELAHTPGVMYAPESGKKFVLQGGGRNDPSVTVEKLREVADKLGLRAEAEKLVNRQVIEAHWVEEQVFETVDLEDPRLAAVVQEHAELIEVLQEAIEVGSPRTVSLYIRDMTPEEIAEAAKDAE